jgi:hypothetical protein
MSIMPASISLYQQAFIQVAVLGLYQSADTVALFLIIRRQSCTSGTLIILFASALPFPALLVPASLLFAIDSPVSIAASWALALHLYLGCLRVRNVARVAPQRWHSCQISFVRGGLDSILGSYYVPPVHQKLNLFLRKVVLRLWSALRAY